MGGAANIKLKTWKAVIIDLALGPPSPFELGNREAGRRKGGGKAVDVTAVRLAALVGCPCFDAEREENGIVCTQAHKFHALLAASKLSRGLVTSGNGWGWMPSGSTSWTIGGIQYSPGGLVHRAQHKAIDLYRSNNQYDWRVSPWRLSSKGSSLYHCDRIAG